MSDSDASSRSTTQNDNGKRLASHSRFQPKIEYPSSPIDVDAEESSEEEEEIDELMSPPPEEEPEPEAEPTATVPVQAPTAAAEKVVTVPAEEVIKVLADEVSKILAEREAKASPASKNKKAKHENSSAAGQEQQADKRGGAQGATAGSSGGPSGSSSINRSTKWTPRMKMALFFRMVLNPAPSMFNEIGKEVGKSGQSCKEHWRKVLMPWIMKIAESEQGGKEE